MPRVTQFHISGDEPESLLPFYEKLFGWKFIPQDTKSPTWYICTGTDPEPGIDGVLHTRQQDNRIVNTVEVDDIEAYAHRIESAGGHILQRLELPVAGKLALFEDTEGNLFQLRQAL